MSFGGKVTNAQFSRADDTSVPFHISYDYQRDKNGDWDNLRILPQLPPVGLITVDEKDPPVTPIELGEPHTEADHAVMTLPKGWSANLPPSVHTKTAFAILNKTYKLENGVLTTDRDLQILQKELPASDWKTYQAWYKDAGLEGENYIQLIPNALNGTAPPAVVSEDNPAAADLIRQVNQAEQRRDLTEAQDRALLDKAQALNPKQAFLWSNYGYLAMQDHHTPEAIADLQKELTFHPDEIFASQLLASYYMIDKQPDQAIATLNAAIVYHPIDDSLVLYIASIETQRNNLPAAEKALRDGLARMPTHDVLQLQLGQVLLREQKTTEGETLLRSVATTSEDPLQINNAAYELANNSLDLPLAETASRRSLDLLDQASNNGETGPNALRRAALLVSAWDTYGWILYRENKIAEAEPWIRASWRNGNEAEPGYHLAILLEKQGHPAEVLHQLELAAKGQRGTDAAAVQKLIDDETAKLRKSTRSSSELDPGIELQNSRIYNFPKSPADLRPSGEGWATVEVDVTTQGIAAFRIVGGDQSLQPLSDTVQKLDLKLDLPPASHARLLRHGVLSCHEGATCQLILVSTAN
jgi:tetratricopeptide (TPR) repeat protein